METTTTPMTIRLRSRDGMERVTLPFHLATVGHLRAAIYSQLGIPFVCQTLSTDQNLLLAKTPHELVSFSWQMREHSAWLHAFGISHGSIVYLACPWERSVSGGPVVAGEPRIFTIADLDQNRPTETDGGAFRYVAQPQPQQQMQSVLPVRRDPEEAVLEANAAVAAVERKRGREVEAAFATKRTRRD